MSSTIRSLLAAPSEPSLETPQELNNGGCSGNGLRGQERVLLTVAGKVGRFNPDNSPTSEEAQLLKRVKLKTQLNFPAFNPRTEKDLEDWVDAISPAGVISRSLGRRRHRVSQNRPQGR